MATKANAQSEAQFQKEVRKEFHCGGWITWHLPRLSYGTPGLPDLICLRPGRLIFAELKTARGRVTKDQQHILELLWSANHEAYVWRPQDWPQIRRVIAGGDGGRLATPSDLELDVPDMDTIRAAYREKFGVNPETG